MDDILKVVLDFVLRDLLLSPGEREKKRLMKLAKRGNSPFGDRVVCMLYVLGYGVLLFGSIWGGAAVSGFREFTVLGYGVFFLSGTLVLEILLLLYSLVVKRSAYHVLAVSAIKRDRDGRVIRYQSLRWRWFLRAWGVLFLLIALCR